ncbi:MAG: tRNA adenosine(34) deaminase TadA [Lachnospiraceae bacterium]|nr:tRNA adenosine(34) deaminase TadA [Lachnospiraceae bacterium]
MTCWIAGSRRRISRCSKAAGRSSKKLLSRWSFAVLTEDEKYMKEALKQARKAYKMGESPIGCVIVYEGRIIGRGYNRRNTDKSTLAHAEISAIKKATKVIGDWRLEDCTIYITLEPCPMCAGAIVQSRIKRCVIGAMSPKSGCAGSILNILDESRFNHRVETLSGVLGEACQQLLSSFFKELRVRLKAEKEAETPESRPDIGVL